MLEESQCFTYAEDLPEWNGSTARSIMKKLFRDTMARVQYELPEVANQPRRHAKVRQAYTEKPQTEHPDLNNLFDRQQVTLTASSGS